MLCLMRVMSPLPSQLHDPDSLALAFAGPMQARLGHATITCTTEAIPNLRLTCTVYIHRDFSGQRFCIASVRVLVCMLIFEPFAYPMYLLTLRPCLA